MTDPLAPRVDADSRGFWEATARGELAICRCQGCRRYLQPPLERCPACASPTEFEVVSGKALLHSFIVVHRAVLPGSVPGQLIGLVDLAEQPGLRLAAQLVDLEPVDVRVGMALEVRFVDLDGGDVRVPVFGPLILQP